jgi:glycosyltransferase involved in cell wall biosynthesis
MKRFSPDAWLVFAPAIQYPDLFGWWQYPKRYVFLGCEGWGKGKLKALPGPWRWLLTASFRRSLLRADMITVLRPKLALSLRYQGVPAERVCVLPLAIKAWNRIPRREEARRELGLPQETPVILCVSRFSVRKNRDDRRPGKTEAVLDLLTAFRALPSNTLLLLVGDGHGRQQLEEEAARLKVAGRVHFAGEVEHSDVSRYYAACDFFACVDNAESNRPYQAMLEAQACGRPVVTMQVHSAQSVIEPGHTGLLAKDPKGFEAHLSTLVQDRSRCEELGREGPAYIARFFSIEDRVRQIEDLLLGRFRGLGTDIHDKKSLEESQSERSDQEGKRWAPLLH